MTHRDCLQEPSGRRRAAGDAAHRQGFSTPSEGSWRQPERQISVAFGLRRARLPIRRIAAPHAPSRKPLKFVPMSHY